MMCKTIDLFAGIGGIRLGFEAYGCKNVFSSEVDKNTQTIYETNFGEKPHGDINLIKPYNIPDHDILLASFSYQLFGFSDNKDLEFSNIEAILNAKKPRAFLLETMWYLTIHDNGRIFELILGKLNALGYTVHTNTLNSLDFGLPQNRKRLYLIGFLKPLYFEFPVLLRKYQPLTTILEDNSHIPQRYFLSDAAKHRLLNNLVMDTPPLPSIWYRRIKGNISTLPYCPSLTLDSSSGGLSVNGVRRLTDREMLRLQGFPNYFKIDELSRSMRRAVANSSSVPVIKAIAGEMIKALQPKFFKAFDFSILNDSDFKEDSVREELILPILKKLGYSLFGENKIVRSKTIKAKLGRKNNINIIPDYLLKVGDNISWVLEAKRPNENILDKKHREQAYEYAVHSDIKAAHYYALCNGKEFVVYHTLKEEHIIHKQLIDFDKKLSDISKILSPKSIKKLDKDLQNLLKKNHGKTRKQVGRNRR